MNDTNSRHVETTELWNRKKPQQMERKSSHNKLGSQIGNVVVRAIMKYNKRNKIYNSCFFQSKQIIAIKMIWFIVFNVDL